MPARGTAGRIGAAPRFRRTPTSGKPYNAPTYVSTPGFSYDGQAVSDAIELDVLYVPGGLFGHPYWLTWAPITNSDRRNENPHIAFSSDGNTWQTTGISNPIVPAPGGGTAGNLADPVLFDNTARDGKLYCYYEREGSSTTSTNGVWHVTSTDGLTWSSPVQTRAADGSNFADTPGVCYDTATSKYWLYTLDLTAGVLYRQTSDNPVGLWSAQVACTFALPNGRLPWHAGRPLKVGTKWIYVTSDASGGANLWLLSSTDGLTWTCASTAVVAPVPGWDLVGLYRGAVVDAQDGTNLYGWYVSGLGQPNRLSQRITIPRTEIP